MTVRECVVHGAIVSEHIVQFFDSDESRAECVAQFLADGIRLGEPAIVVAKPSNWAAVSEQLENLKVPVQTAIDDGMLVIRDAADTLRRLSRHGVPDADAFEAIVGKAVAGLAQRGELAEAIKLEHLWNALGERVPFFLMCGYSAAHFVATATHRALREICGSHSAVHRHAQDPLATWLLTSAHNAPGASAITH